MNYGLNTSSKVSGNIVEYILRYIHVYIYIYTYICILFYLLKLYVYIHIHTQTNMCIYVRVCACVYVHMDCQGIQLPIILAPILKTIRLSFLDKT